LLGGHPKNYSPRIFTGFHGIFPSDLLASEI
jgi:hypothetical protein